jgi:glycosyltransferase involved in cell wall biosynthesis
MKNIDQSTKPLVSVIIPALNAAKYIRQALDSVLSQTYKRIEAIVVDDGSSDATSTIIEEFVKRDSRVQLVWQSNAGVGAARNTAIGKARGKYIAPLDADDFWFPEKLEKQVACMEQYGIETGLVYCWSTLIDEHGDFFSNGLPQTVEGRLRHALILRNVVGCASVPLFRASALEQVGLYLTRAEQAGAQGCEDWDLSLRIAEIFSIRVVPESLVAYRQTIKYECSDRRNGGILRRHHGSGAPAKLRLTRRHLPLVSREFLRIPRGPVHAMGSLCALPSFPERSGPCRSGLVAVNQCLQGTVEKSAQADHELERESSS